jgi:hypothetical protein
MAVSTGRRVLCSDDLFHSVRSAAAFRRSLSTTRQALLVQQWDLVDVVSVDAGMTTLFDVGEQRDLAALLIGQRVLATARRRQAGYRCRAVPSRSAAWAWS